MIAFLEGILVEKSPARIIMNVGGVGYEVAIPLSSYDSLPAPGRGCRVLVCEYIREDQHALFGFASEFERRTFNLLISVNGIGPKTALSALSSMTVPDLNAAIVAGDTARLATIAGIGKKTAERMVLELRDKVASSEMMVAGAGGRKECNKTADAVLALVSLGYKQIEAAKMAAAAAAGGEDFSVEEIVRRALKR
ncbi:MAG: Holliday junction branch migration protein RuvA [Kiritimatiellia bacterium]